MKLLLTSSGIANDSIRAALVDLLGKPIEECDALAIATAMYSCGPMAPQHAYRFLAGKTNKPLVNLGWKSVGVLELTALPTIKKEYWVEAVENADVLLVWGGDVLYLRRWMNESGLAEALPRLKAVYVGVSAGAMVTASRIGETCTLDHHDFDADTQTEPFEAKGSDGEPMKIIFAMAPGLGLVDFSLFPHVWNEQFPENAVDLVETWAKKLSKPTYAIDDATAIKVVDGQAHVVSEGQWKLFDG